jgi:hypothetical protein
VSIIVLRAGEPISPHEFGRFGYRVDEVRLLRRQRLEAIDHAGALGRLAGRRQDVAGALACFRHRRAVGHAALLRRAVHQVLPAEFGAQVDQFDDDLLRARPRLGVLAGDGHAGRRQQQKVQPRDRHPGLFRRLAHVAALGGRKFVRRLRQGERRDLHRVVSQRGGQRALVRERQIAQHLVA